MSGFVDYLRMAMGWWSSPPSEPATPTNGIVLCNVVGHTANASMVGSVGSVEATGYIGVAVLTGQGEC